MKKATKTLLLRGIFFFFFLICEVILLTLGGPEMQVSAWFFLFPEHPQFLIRLRIKAHPCIHDLIKSEPALSPGEHPRIDLASYLVVLEAVTNCGFVCISLSFPIPLPLYLLPSWWNRCTQALPWFYAPSMIWDLSPLKKKIQRTSYFPNP